MVLPVLQSLLTLGLLLAAFGFMARRLWHIGVLINTGTRGDEVLTDNPGERTADDARLHARARRG